MYKKIKISVLMGCIVLLSCKAKSNLIVINSSKNDTTLVYQNKKVIGKINQETKFKCIACFVLNKVRIGKKEINMKIPVSNREINNKTVLAYDFAIDKISRITNKVVIKYSSTSSTKSYEINLEDKTPTTIVKNISYSYGMKDIKIGENEYAPFQSNFVCKSEKKMIIKDTILLGDNSKFTTSECFDCPVKYTIEECLENKKKGIKMKWE